MGVAHRLEYSWVRLPAAASRPEGACSVYITSWHGAVISQVQEACLMCVVFPFLQILPVSHGLQLLLLVAIVVLGGLGEIC